MTENTKFDSKLKLIQYKPIEVETLFYHDKCDKYDYLIAAGCGAIAGLIDVFFVGKPGDSKLGVWTDKQVEKVVEEFANICGYKKTRYTDPIRFLEDKFHVNYDQPTSDKVSSLFSMSPNNHRMKSLAHSPDIIGLFFSILNQFTSTATFLNEGKVIIITTDEFELRGTDFVSKIFCGFVNWLGHIMADIQGSSTAEGRGSGIVIPFYELFGLCDFGRFNIGKETKTIAQLATTIFERGYDARHGLTMSIPVVMADLIIRLCWAIKQYYVNQRPLKECIPSCRHDDLRMMLIIGDGMLCLMDGADATFKSNGSWIEFFLRCNIIAWYKLIRLSTKEICIQLGIKFPLDKEINAYIQLNDAVRQYADAVKQIDLDHLREDVSSFERLSSELLKIDTDEELNHYLTQQLDDLRIAKPWGESFELFVENDNPILRFS